MSKLKEIKKPFLARRKLDEYISAEVRALQSDVDGLITCPAKRKLLLPSLGPLVVVDETHTGMESVLYGGQVSVKAPGFAGPKRVVKSIPSGTNYLPKNSGRETFEALKLRGYPDQTESDISLLESPK